MSNLLKFALAGSMLALGATAANAAPTTFTSGLSSIGVADNGGLGEGTGGVFLGLDRAGTGDAITPGCLCQGWGTSGDGSANWVYGLGDNFSASSLAGSTVTTTTTFGTTVTHTYSSIAGTDLFKVDITITNSSGGPLASNRYGAVYDWDVPPGHFSDDFTTVYGGPTGTGGKLINTSFNPFRGDVDTTVLDGAGGCGIAANTNGTNVPGDCGGWFVFEFGALADGESASFTTVIGSARDVSTLLSQFGALSVEAYHYTFDNDGPAVFGYGFVGVGLPPIDTPAPGAIALFGLGLAGLGLARRRRA
jgi:type IV pilus assembly protein PilY1